MSVTKDGNKINFSDEFGHSEIHKPLAFINEAVNKMGYSEIVLNFSECTAAFPGPMLALCAQIMRLRKERVDAQIILPKNERLSRLFHNANWAHYLEPRKSKLSSFRGHTQVAATQFTTPDEQNRAVNRIVNAILGAIPDIERTDFAALEWSINEITDNVIVHSESPIGGLVQVSTFQRREKIIEYIVADAGLGIPATLRSGHPQIQSDIEALDQAVREGVTRDKSLGQGNGLYGSYQICAQGGGRFQIESGNAKLLYMHDRGLSISTEDIPIEGTLIIAQIDFSSPRLLGEALRFSGHKYSHADFVETRYEQYQSQDLIFVLMQESRTFGSRLAGTPVRNKIINLLQMCPGQRLVIDCSGISIVSSSFADEVFGKLFVKLGPLGFMQRIAFDSVEPTVRSLIDKAISQRMTVD
jgi:hypothetical protein